MATNQAIWAPFIGLYYPFMHFKDDAWIKLAALYWDQMGRIVPGGFRTRDSATVQRLRDELNFVYDVSPGFTPEFEEQFRALLEQHAPELKARYGIARRDNWPSLSETGESAPPGADPRLSYVYCEKMPPELWNRLVEEQLAEATWDRGGALVGMHPKLKLVYMTALAEELAARNNLHPITDETKDHLAISGWTLKRLAEVLLEDVKLADGGISDEGIEAQLAMITFQSVVPCDIQNVPVESIIAFRKGHRDELSAFQQGMHELTEQISQIQGATSPGAIQANLETVYTKKIRPEVDAYRGRLNSLAIETVLGAVNVRVIVPSLVSEALKGFGKSPDPILTGAVALGSVVYSMVPVIRDKRKQARELQAKTPVAYLMHAEEGLQPATLRSRITRGARQFVVGV